MGVPCFMVVPSNATRRYLRRYKSSSVWDAAQQKSVETDPCPAASYHNAKIEIERGTDTRNDEGIWNEPIGDSWPHGDARWPASCACGYAFKDEDQWQLFIDHVFVREDGQPGEYSLRDRVPGMMWDAPWMGEWARGRDGRCLVVVLPNGYDWMIDGRGSNCTLKDDAAHRCWIRHGTPPALTVDKNASTPDASAATTCAAGAGSIQAGNWHGFLRNGELVL